MSPKRPIGSYSKTGWLNRVGRGVLSLKKRPAPSQFLDYQTRTFLVLPFKGEWYVFWGGRSVGENYHAVTCDQRFAYDFVVLRESRSCAGRGNNNADYFCFGQTIFAPGDGAVVEANDGVADNVPGEMNRKCVPGNHVVIDHGNSEFSFLAHLKNGTVRVQREQNVRAGDPIGECGNSGNSSEPHLHYHLQNTAILFKGEGLPVLFHDYVVDGRLVERGEPRARQAIRSQRDRD